MNSYVGNELQNDLDFYVDVNNEDSLSNTMTCRSAVLAFKGGYVW
jgi:hypothetical protein